MEIDIYADVICPWCYLGVHRLNGVLAALPIEPIVRYHPFQLDPNMSDEPVPALRWLGARYGGQTRARQMSARVAAIAADEGLTLDFDRALIANTFTAHRLLWFAGTPTAVAFGADAQTQPDLADALYRAHFTDGLNINSVETLTEIAVGLGLAADRVAALLRTDDGATQVRAELATAHGLGITSVPTMIFAGRYSITGAQHAATLAELLAEVIRREGVRENDVLGFDLP